MRGVPWGPGVFHKADTFVRSVRDLPGSELDPRETGWLDVGYLESEDVAPGRCRRVYAFGFTDFLTPEELARGVIDILLVAGWLGAKRGCQQQGRIVDPEIMRLNTVAVYPCLRLWGWGGVVFNTAHHYRDPISGHMDYDMVADSIASSLRRLNRLSL